MCGGETVKVTLEFNRKVIEGVYDEFGTKTKIKPCGECFTARVDVQISPTFWGGVPVCGEDENCGAGNQKK